MRIKYLSLINIWKSDTTYFEYILSWLEFPDSLPSSKLTLEHWNLSSVKDKNIYPTYQVKFFPYKPNFLLLNRTQTSKYYQGWYIKCTGIGRTIRHADIYMGIVIGNIVTSTHFCQIGICLTGV